MTQEEIKKSEVDLSTKGYKMVELTHGRWACSYGMNGLAAVKHQYMTPQFSSKTLYDIYLKGEYVTTFSSKKAAMAYLEMRDKGMEVGHLKALVQKAYDLNKNMIDFLTAFVREHGGLIRTDTYGKDFKDKHVSPIYVISMQGDDEPNTEHRVLAVALFDDEIAVLPALSENSYTKETLDGMTDQEIRDLDNWEWFSNGYIMQNATLLSICESIEEYV